MTAISFIAALTTITIAGAASAQTTHSHTSEMDHTTMTDHSAVLPIEPGQGAFASIAEIVVMLSTNPETDWSNVNIGALRAHLVDMDMLITNADVITSEVKNGIQMRVSLSGLGGDAAGRMVPAHGPVLKGETGWQSDVTVGKNEILWVVASPENTAKIRALGFFGLMALGDHHRAHHIGMARGNMMH